MTQHTTNGRGQAGSTERGVALPLAMFAIVALLIGSTGALLIGAGEIQQTRNYRGTQQVHAVAESGLTHALQNVNAVGVIDFENEVVNNWDNFMGSSRRSFPGMAGYAYAVTTLENAANPTEQGWIVSTGFGPEGVMNTVSARVEQSNIPGTAPGAIYLANDNPTDSTFQGNNFEVNGNDFNYDGSPGGGPAVPGMATRNDTNTNEAVTSLNAASQYDNVQGTGYQAGPPAVPSVQTAPTGASVDQLDALVDSLLSQGSPPVHTYNDKKITGSEIFGDDGLSGSDPPQISHFTGNQLEIRANGTASGAGIMIVDGDLTIQGTLDFRGLIIVRGETRIEPYVANDGTILTGNATVYGSLWTNNLDLTVGGAALIRYSTQALSLADQVGLGGTFPAPLNVLALINCAAVPNGVDGCP